LADEMTVVGEGGNSYANGYASREHFRLPAGEHNIEARATDGAGRQSYDSWHFRIGQP